MAFGVQALDAVASGAFVIRALECLTSLTAITFGLGYFDVVRNFCAVVEAEVCITRCATWQSQGDIIPSSSDSGCRISPRRARDSRCRCAASQRSRG